MRCYHNMLVDPRVIAERRRLEPIYFFIYEFLKEHEIEFYRQPEFLPVFVQADRDGDGLLNRKEFRWLMRGWARNSYTKNVRTKISPDAKIEDN